MSDLPAGLTVSSGALLATFLPELGMLGASLRHRGEELLALPGGLDGYRAGEVTGLPLLAPWANRLGERRYEVEGVVVDLEGLSPPHRRPGPPDPRHDVGPARLGGRRPDGALVHGAVRLRRAPRPPRLVPLPPRAPDRGRGGGRHDAAGGDDPHSHDRSSGPRLVRLPPLPPPARGSGGRMSASASPPVGTSSSTSVDFRREWPAPRTPRTSGSGRAPSTTSMSSTTIGGSSSRAAAAVSPWSSRRATRSRRCSRRKLPTASASNR